MVHTGDYGQIEGQLAEIAAVASVSFDFGSKPASYAELLLPQVQIATFSGSELDDAAVLERIRWAQARGARTVIVTRGALGSHCSRTAPTSTTSRPVLLSCGTAWVPATPTRLR